MKGGGEHRRGRSMGSTTQRADSKDEDLALFHEMKRREKHNFLHPSPDDLDISLSSKFGGMGASAKKSGTDLLTSDVDKNDYDWLLTPPGTPLFPSLDQEAAALAVISPQAALLNGPSPTLSSTSVHSPADPSPKTTRGNPSPRRAGSTTPNGTMSRSRSTPHNSTPVVATTVTRPSTPTSSLTRPSTPTSSLTRPSTPTSKLSSTSSVRASTPNLKLSISASKSSSSTASTPTGTRPSTPNARSSTPPVRPSTPGARSSTPTSKPSTPTMRRSLSGGRITSPATTRGGPSPKRTTSSRGNSPSAKRVTPIITTVAGMCSEAPPNLRTTVPERTSSTPKSSNGSRALSESGHASEAMDASGRGRRRPRSPSVSRSFSSSSSQDQRTSSQTSRGSVISSYDDGIEVSRPTLHSSRNSAAGKWHAAGHEDLLSGKANTNVQAKRVSKSLVISSSSSVSGGTQSKKSLEPNKWQGEAYQHSPSSYRHLMASSPGSPFYGTRANSLLVRPGSAMNSSVTTSSNASSEHGTTVAPDTEGSERDDDDLLSWDSYGRRMSPSPRGGQADILMLDKDEEKVSGWQDFERLSGNGLVASYKPGMQSTLDTEVTSFYESDGIASLEMLEQLGLMGEVYNSKKTTSGERVLERRASNIEDGKMELRRSGERPLQRRASNIEDSRIPDLSRSDDGNGHGRAAYTKLLGPDGPGNPGQQVSKLERLELLESFNEARKYEIDLLRNYGEKVLGPQKSKVSNAEIHAACLFVRDFRVGLAPPQGQETSPSLSHSLSAPVEEAANPNWVGDGGESIMSRKDFGNVRQTHDFSQSKSKSSGGGRNLTQIESKLPRRPLSRGKVGSSESLNTAVQVTSMKADNLRHEPNDEADQANSSALSCLVDVMERIKHESSQPKYLDLENQDSKTISSTGDLLDGQFYVDSFRLPARSQASESRRGLSYDEIHAMDEVDTPELHDIEDDSLLFDGGKDELELLENLHRNALQKEEVKAAEEERFHESPKRRFVAPIEASTSTTEADELHESPKRRCVEVKCEDVATIDATVVHGSPSRFFLEEADINVASMNLDDFPTPPNANETEVERTEEAIMLGGCLQSKDFDDRGFPKTKVDKFTTSEEKSLEDVAGSKGEATELPTSSGVGVFPEDELIATKQVVMQASDFAVHPKVFNNQKDGEHESERSIRTYVPSEDNHASTVVFDAPRHSGAEDRLQEAPDCEEKEEILPPPTDIVVVHELHGVVCSALTPDIAQRSEEMHKHLADAEHVKDEANLCESISRSPDHQNKGPSVLASDSAEEVNDCPKVLEDDMEVHMVLDSPKVTCVEYNEDVSSMLATANIQVREMDQPIMLKAQLVVGSVEEGKNGSSLCRVEESSGVDLPIRGGNRFAILNNVVALQPKDLPEVCSMVANDEVYHGGDGTGAVLKSGTGSDDISVETFTKAPEGVRSQPEDESFSPVSRLEEMSDDEMEDSQESEDAFDETLQPKRKGVEEVSLVRTDILAEQLQALEQDDRVLGQGLASRESTPGAPVMYRKSEAAVLDPHDAVTMGTDTGNSSQISQLYTYNGSLSTPDTVSSKDQDVEEALTHNGRIMSQEAESDFHSQSAGTDMFSVSVNEPHVMEDSQSLEYCDTKSMDTSDYFEATSEEKLDSQEVSSAIRVETNPVEHSDSDVLRSDERNGASEVISKVRGRLPTPLSEMRSASSLCAALEEQLAGLIQKIDSAIEESSKPFISGQQEVMVGKGKLSARTSELLREQGGEDVLEPVRSSQEDDLLDMLWAEDDDSAYSEGSGDDECSQGHELKVSTKDDTPNQVNGEIRLSRSSENGLTHYSNGHANDANEEGAMPSSPTVVEIDLPHTDSPKSSLEAVKTHRSIKCDNPPAHENVADVVLADTGALPSSGQQDSGAADTCVVLDQQGSQEKAKANSADVLEVLDEDHKRKGDEGEEEEEEEGDVDSILESSKGEKDSMVSDEVYVSDHPAFLRPPVEDVIKPVEGNGSPSAEDFVPTAQLLAARGEEAQRLEGRLSIGPAGEDVLTVNEVELSEERSSAETFPVGMSIPTFNKVEASDDELSTGEDPVGVNLMTMSEAESSGGTITSSEVPGVRFLPLDEVEPFDDGLSIGEDSVGEKSPTFVEFESEATSTMPTDRGEDPVEVDFATVNEAESLQVKLCINDDVAGERSQTLLEVESSEENGSVYDVSEEMIFSTPKRVKIPRDQEPSKVNPPTLEEVESSKEGLPGDDDQVCRSPPTLSEVRFSAQHPSADGEDISGTPTAVLLTDQGGVDTYRVPEESQIVKAVDSVNQLAAREVIVEKSSEESEDSALKRPASECLSSGDLVHSPEAEESIDDGLVERLSIACSQSRRSVKFAVEEVSDGGRAEGPELGPSGHQTWDREGPTRNSSEPFAGKDLVGELPETLGRQLPGHQISAEIDSIRGTESVEIPMVEMVEVFNHSFVENDIAGVGSPISEKGLPDPSPVDEKQPVASGKFEEKIQEDAEDNDKDESSVLHAMLGLHSPENDLEGHLVYPATRMSGSELGKADFSSLPLDCAKDEGESHNVENGVLKEDLAEKQLVPDGNLIPVSDNSPMPPLVSFASSREHTGPKPVDKNIKEPSQVSDVANHQITKGLVEDDVSPVLRVSELEDVRTPELSGPSNSAVPEKVQHPLDVDRTVLTESEDSFQECRSHGSSSLSTSMGSMEGSSEQEANSAGTKGVGEEEQEETSKLQGTSGCNSKGDGFATDLRPRTSSGVTLEGQTVIDDKVDLCDGLEQSRCDTLHEQSEMDSAVDSELSLRDAEKHDGALLMLGKGPEWVECVGQLNVPIHSMSLPVDGDDVVCLKAESNHLESHSAGVDVLDPGCLGDSPALNGSSIALSSDDMQTTEKPGSGKLLESCAVHPPTSVADTPEAQTARFIPDVKIRTSDNRELPRIDDDAWEEQPDKRFSSTERTWIVSDSPSEGAHLVNELEALQGPKVLPSTADRLNSLEVKMSNKHSEPSERPGTGEEVSGSTVPNVVSASDINLTGTGTMYTEEQKEKCDVNISYETGNLDASNGSERMNGVGSQSAKKLPISKAKSVRTIPLGSTSNSEPLSEGRLSPDAALQEQKPIGYTSVTVVSPENLQWEPSLKGDLGHKGTVESAGGEEDLGKWNAQGVNSSPASVRRALAYMGQQASSFTPIDTVLQSPVTQMFERDAKSTEKDHGIPQEKAATYDVGKPDIMSPPKLMLSPVNEMKAMEAPAHAIIEVSPKGAGVPIKAQKAKCACTIM